MFDINELDDKIANEGDIGDPIEDVATDTTVVVDPAKSGEHEADTFESLEFEMGEGDQATKLTGKDILGWKEELDRVKAELQEKTNQPVIQQQPLIQQQVQQRTVQTEDPILQVRAQAQEALTKFANGDLEAIPVLLDAIGRFSQMQAQQTTTAAYTEQQREAQFLAAHPEVNEVVAGALTQDFKNFMVKNPFYSDPVRAFLAFKMERTQAAHAAEVAKLTAQIAEAAKTGEKKGQKTAEIQGKARGTLRLVGQGQSRPAGTRVVNAEKTTLTPIGNPNFVDDLADAMLNQYQQMHSK